MNHILPDELWQLVARHACRVHNGVGIIVSDTQVLVDSFLDYDHIRAVVFQTLRRLPGFAVKRSSLKQISFKRPDVVDLKGILKTIAESLPKGFSLCNRCFGLRCASFGILEHSQLFAVSKSLRLNESRDGTGCPMPL